MGILLYNISLSFFNIGVRIAALFNRKANDWVKGRKNLFKKIERSFTKNENEKVIWMHCASLGEFEQGRPLLEKIRLQYPGSKILLSFFSPSGYEVRKKYEGADWVFYLPMDGSKNAKRFLNIVNPSLVIFIKYEFWYHYLQNIKTRNIPFLLVSGIFRNDMPFFKWYGGIFRKMLSAFSWFFVQDESSKKLLAGLGITNADVTGDTRFDRVVEICQNPEPVPVVEQFATNSKVIVAGSTWQDDEKLLQKVSSAIKGNPVKLIIAPHEINENHLNDIERLFPGAFRFSRLQATNIKPGISNTLIIDNIGLLSRLYKYGYITYVGGGFNKSGIHNILEAAVYGKPVLFGPYYHKFKEAADLIENKGAYSVQTTEEAIAIFQKLIGDNIEYQQSCKSSYDYVYTNQGATDKIMGYIYKNRLLTS